MLNHALINEYHKFQNFMMITVINLDYKDASNLLGYQKSLNYMFWVQN